MGTGFLTNRGKDRWRGFTLVELILSLSLLTLLMGIVFNLIWRLQRGYTHEKQIAEMQQNQRFAMEFISRTLRTAGNNPEGIALDKITLDSDGNGQNDDIRIESDFNPPDGDILDDGEDVMFRVAESALRYRNGPPGMPETVLVGNITGLTFAAFDGNGNSTADVNLMTRITLTITARTSWASLQTGTAQTKTLSTTINLRR